jgi:hypothetical protein
MAERGDVVGVLAELRGGDGGADLGRVVRGE